MGQYCESVAWIIASLRAAGPKSLLKSTAESPLRADALAYRFGLPAQFE
jgi:hypothetical protein